MIDKIIRKGSSMGKTLGETIMIPDIIDTRIKYGPLEIFDAKIGRFRKATKNDLSAWIMSK